ncbi:hypothetical protein [Bizionia sp.]|uniref:hypothetical protein n=1 Tax=Bizionia sp. TaxID=1954480 RepID=UPI003A92B631
MIQAKHCDLCDYPKRSLKTGLTCGLTNKIPEFKVSCAKIKFSDSFKEHLTDLLNQIEQVRKNKRYVYLNFTLLSIFGLIIMILGNHHRSLEQVFDMEFDYLSWIYFQDALLVYILGVIFILMGFYTLNKYRKTLKELNSDKREIKLILNNYNIDIETLLNREK